MASVLAGPREVLDFWYADDTSVHWFAAEAGFDDTVRERIADTFEAALRGELDGWAGTPEGWLALLLVLDQFGRNIHRGTARAFAGDVRAQALAMAGLARGDDLRLPRLWRVFAYLPLEHAEDLRLQQHSVTRFRALAVQAPANEAALYRRFLDYALRHCEVVTRYGRFPHRNAVLGRAETDEERAYLAQPDTGF